jgi:hypothetical protein
MYMNDASLRFIIPFLRASIATVVIFAPYAFIAFKKPSIWYYYPWLDIPFHIAGGVVASLWAFLLLSLRARTAWRAPLFFGIVLAIGIGWEYFEYLLDMYSHAHWLGSTLDTSGDILNDMIGATIAWVMLRKRM